MPREFKVSLERTTAEVRSFEGKQSEIRKVEAQAKGSAAGASLGALGLAVATVAMGVATTFGVASAWSRTRRPSGAAATSASLAWIGGGALVAGGGGVAAALVNVNLTLARLINKEITVDAES